jgi:hypothetical protein
MAPTKPDTTRQPTGGLNVAQQNAVDALASGMNDAETAAAVGTSRQTVNGWRNHDPAFRAALNARRADVWGAAADKLRSLVPRAVAVLEGSLNVNPDPTVALAVLKLAGLAERAAPLSLVGPTTVAAIVDAEIIARREADDPLAAILSGGPITATERRALEAELAALLALGAGE